WQVEDDTGAVGAFRLHYAIVRQRGLLDAVVGSTAPDARADFSYGLAGWVAVPVRPDRGESLEVALRPRSGFRRIIDALDPRPTAGTFWVYPDSFALYRRVRHYCLTPGLGGSRRPPPGGVSMGR